VVTPSAYLLFYRRRSDVPLGPPFLQKIVDRFHNPGSNDAADDDELHAPKSRNASRSPAGNGSRLDGLSRNGSSSAFGAAAGALRGGGSALAGSLQLKGAAAGTADADDQEMLLGGQQEDLPAYDEDEGYADNDDDRNFSPVNVENVYDPLYRQMGGVSRYGIGNNTPDWNFDQLGGNQDTLDDYDNEAFDEDAASDAPNLGSRAGNDLDERMLEDFGDELSGGVQGLNPGLGTPLEEEVPPLLGGEMGDGEVADVVLDDEVSVEGPMTGRVKLD
jgi:ubiquitin carboxyl-terminal hydrolase 4/11/15